MRRRRAPSRPVTGRLSSSGHRHWDRRTPRQLARPASSGGGVTFLMLLMVIGVALVLALGAQ